MKNSFFVFQGNDARTICLGKGRDFGGPGTQGGIGTIRGGKLFFLNKMASA